VDLSIEQERLTQKSCHLSCYHMLDSSFLGATQHFASTHVVVSHPVAYPEEQPPVSRLRISSNDHRRNSPTADTEKEENTEYPTEKEELYVASPGHLIVCLHALTLATLQVPLSS
jgi:hypothetical protein